VSAPARDDSMIELWFDADASARLIVNADLRVLASNSASEAVIAAGDVLTVRAGILAARDKVGQAGLVALVGADDMPPALLASDAHDAPVVLRASTLRPGECYGLVIIRVASLSEGRLPDLSQIYRLTRAEKNLVAAMIRGETNASVARGLGLSVETVRTHLKNACAKMGVNSRAALTAKMFELMA